MILMFVAVRLIQIREALILPYNRKQTGDKVWHEKTSAGQVVSDDVWQVLWLKMESKKLPDKPPPLIWLFQTIAKLSGWCDSKHTGRPGWLAVWKGLFKLQIGVEVCRMARQFWG